MTDTHSPTGFHIRTKCLLESVGGQSLARYATVILWLVFLSNYCFFLCQNQTEIFYRHKLMVVISRCPPALCRTAFCNLKHIFWGLFFSFLLQIHDLQVGVLKINLLRATFLILWTPKKPQSSFDLQILYRCVDVGSIGTRTEGRPRACIHTHTHARTQ